MLATLADAAGNWDASEDTSVWCQVVMKSQSFVLQKADPEAVQVVQQGQGFLFCIEANCPTGSMFRRFAQNSRVSLDDLKTLQSSAHSCLTGDTKLSSWPQRGLSVVSALVRPKPRLTSIPAERQSTSPVTYWHKGLWDLHCGRVCLTIIRKYLC